MTVSCTRLALWIAFGSGWAGARTLPLSLSQAMDLARDSGLAAQTADSRRLQAEDRSRQALAPMLPRLDLQAYHMVRSYNLASTGLYPSQYVPLFGNEDARLAARWTLLDLSSLSHWKAAQVSAQSATATHRAARDQAAFDAGLAWIDLARARALLRSRDSAAVLAKRLRSMAEEQSAAGSATRLDVIRARNQEVLTARAVSQARLAVETARLNLRDRLGLSPEIVPEASDTLPLAADPSDTVLAAGDSRDRLPEVLAARSAAEAAALEARAERRTLLPTLGISGDYGLSGYRLNSAAEWTGSVAVTATWNLWEGGSRQQKLRIAAETGRQAELALRARTLRADLDTRTTKAAVREGAIQVECSSQAATLSDQELELAMERFRSGASGNADVVQAQVEASNAHAAWVDAAGAFQAARLKLLYATGNLDRLETKD